MRPPALLRTVRAALQAAAEPARAPGMQAYMKSTMPYHGVPAATLRAVCRAVFAAYAPDDADAWRADVLGLWRSAGFREERYAAIALSGHKAAAAFQTVDALPMYEEMIVTGAWWDYVDDVATHRVRPLLVAQPRVLGTVMRAWSKSPDLWKRRTSIICQVGRRDATDRALLFACIEPSLPSKEFFLRKAIGWALRDLAWHAPDEVVAYVQAHAAALSGLSKREALKHAGRAR